MLHEITSLDWHLGKKQIGQISLLRECAGDGLEALVKVATCFGQV